MSHPWEKFPEHDILGAPVRAMKMDDVVRAAEAVIDARGHMHIGVVNAAKVVNMQRDAALREAVLKSDLILADGIAVVWAGRLLGKPVPQRVAGIDLMTRLLELADRRAWRVYLLGATEEVNGQVAGIVGERYPRVVVAGRRNGYYAPAEEERIAQDVRAARADMIFVAMSPPRKELFLARWGDMMQVPVSHGVGGAFDVVAGKVRRAPRLWQRLGMEWLYRVMQEPRRMWRRYLVTNTLFIWMLAGRLLGVRRGAPPGPGVSGT